MSESDYLGIVSICFHEMVTIQKILTYDHFHLNFCKKGISKFNLKWYCFEIHQFCIVSMTPRSCIISYHILLVSCTKFAISPMSDANAYLMHNLANSGSIELCEIIDQLNFMLLCIFYFYQ